MGYEASFSFDLRISADKVEEMEQAYFKAQKKTDYRPGDFCEHFNSEWGDGLAHEEAPVPLEALASGSTRGNILIIYSTFKKWRSWEEPMMESIAEFVDAGGSVEIHGEDAYKTNWCFDGECMTVEDEESIRCWRLRELEAKEKELEELKLFLESVRDWKKDCQTIASGWARWLKVEKKLFAPALEQLAEQAE
jgi:hypothetical protein